jgi:hypothetical protein
MAHPQLLRYPLDIIDSTTDYMFLEVMEYVPSKVPTFDPGSGRRKPGTGTDVFKSAGTKAKQSIILPIPNSIASVNRTGWGESRISALAGSGLKAAGLLVDAATGKLPEGSSLGETAADFAASEASGLGGGTGTGFDLYRKYFKTQAQRAIVNAVAGTSIGLNDVLGRQEGQIINQNVELLFNSVSIRPFGFNWDLTPRNINESKSVLQIIKTLKRTSAAKSIKGKNAFLQAPDVFRLSYKKGTADQKYLNKFKLCALTSVGVDYTGSGIHATYNDGTPIHYRLNLSFTELEPVYAEDYDDNYNDAGF